MSNKSGTSGQIISLPKGGGALHGIGEKFSPDLHTGTGNFTIPIALPPGRNGFQPQLSLVYSTGNGNGPFGLGWSLSIPGVSRKTSKGIPIYDDSKDTFILSGAEDLVLVREERNVGPNKDEIHRYYRPRTEGLFAKIKHISSNSTNHWEVSSKDGLVSFYGTPGAADNNPAVVANPDLLKRTKVFAWKLTQTVDPFGNHIEYEYESDFDRDDFHRWNQLYLKQIRYADYNQNNETKFIVSVTFIYDDEDYPENHPNKRRPDPFSEYRSGFEIRTRKRCKWILIKTHTDSERLVRGYELIYLDERSDLEDLEGLLPLNNVSLLSQIKAIGHDGENSEELPPLEFSYTQFEPNKRKFFPLKGMDLPSRSLANQDLELVDLFGHGLPDILEMNGTVRYWRNLGQGGFDLPREMRDAPPGYRLADIGVQLIDADGDGRTDLLVTTEGISGYYPLRFGGMWDRRSFQPYNLAPSFNLEDPEVRLVDIDGDGVTDAIRSGARLECFFNYPKEGWNGTRRVERQALEIFPNVNFSDPRVKWADMTGDGMQDIVLVHDGSIEYWPNLGYGDWGKRVSMRNSPRFPYGYDPKSILIGDVDGDGLADIVYVDDTKVTLWINQSGNRWSDPIEILGTPPVSDMDAVRLADMFGSGISGVLWSREANGLSCHNLNFLDFTGGVKPYVLNRMDNHMGSETRVEYAPSTSFYLEDEKKPETRWKTPLPFPVQVVARVEVIDTFSESKLTTEYKYHHGYWDGGEREFRGFGLTETKDTLTFERYNMPGLHGEEKPFAAVERKRFSPPTLTKTWFHQGPIGDEFGEWKETDFSAEFWQSDPQVLSRPPEMKEFLRNLEKRRVKRDALRTLRGRILRTELYALDGTELQDRPYTVAEYLYGVREEEPPGNGEKERLHIFFPYTIAERTTQWERGDDPMTQFTFMDDYDNYGQLRQQTAVGLPRRAAKQQEPHGVANMNEERILATHSRTEYAKPDTDIYINDRIAQAHTFVLKNPPRIIETERNNIARVLLEQAAAAEAIHQQFNMLLHEWAKGGSLPVDKVRFVSHTINHYDGNSGQAFAGRHAGQVGPYGALTRSESLVFTDAELSAAYGDQRPSYLGGSSQLPSGAPDGFGNNLGYKRCSINGYYDGYYIDNKRQKFDFHDRTSVQKRGIVVALQDAIGHQIDIKYDTFMLLPIEVIDAVGLKTKAEYDYRLLQPKEVTDPNGNRTNFTFTPLGLLEDTFVMGKAGNNKEGDQARASVHMTYDFLAFKNSPLGKRKPIYVSTLRYIHHDTENDVPIQKRGETIKTVEYSDGFGRLVQTRTQSERIRFGDAIFGGDVLPQEQNDPKTQDNIHGQENASENNPNVVVSGWQIYDNKGRVVEKYEPFFSAGWDYVQPSEEQFGQKATIFYDPRGHVIRTLNPDGSEQRVIYGVPLDLTNPENFVPTSWEVYTYDANDNAGRTHDSDSKSYEHHRNTPASSVIDSLGRKIATIERNRAKNSPRNPLEPIEDYSTRSTYDIQGNLLTVTDALNRPAFKHHYDLIKRPLGVESIDAGIRLTVLDALGNPVEQIDSKGAIILRTYDDLNRLILVWAQDGTGKPLTLRERLIYGDSSDSGLIPAQAEALNFLGKLYKHYDEAGLQTIETYDFKGNVLEKTRQVISDKKILDMFRQAVANNWQVQAYRVNWQPQGTMELEAYARELLGEISYQTSFTYDALNRVKTMQYPQDADGKRKILRPHYNRAGALERVEMDGSIYVDHIAYNAKGQRILIAFGNGLMTRYAYDPKTFRLIRMRTEKYIRNQRFYDHISTN